MSLYGLIIGIAIYIGWEYFSRHNHIIPKSLETRFIVTGVALSIVGARLYHVAGDWNYYSQNLMQIFNTRAGGLGIYGGLIFGILYIYVFCLVYRLSFIGLLDTLAPIIPLCQSIGRLGNFVNQEIPFWWLESALSLILFFVLRLWPKQSFAKYLIGYGLIRFLFEFFRQDTWIIGQFKIAQVLSIISLSVGIILLRKQQTRRH